MKLIHLSDLHLGKRVNEFSMHDDQVHILAQIIEIIAREAPDGVLIAGDVYDKPIPSAESVLLFDQFLAELTGQGFRVFIISGNHDSAERIAFGGRIMQRGGVHLSPVWNGGIEPITLTDRFGAVDIYLLPFIKPVHVRRLFPDASIESYTDALRTAIGALPLCTQRRNILVTHQLVTGSTRCDSEELSVGGSDNVDASVFDPFDYVALGHLHGPQRAGRDTVRYCGSPLQYSFSEAGQQKSITVVELFEQGQVEIRTVPLVPLHKLCEIRGRYLEVTARSFYEDTTWNTDYMRITLTDEEDIPDAAAKLRTIYHNLMRLDYDNCRTRSNTVIDPVDTLAQKPPLTLFAEFYEKQNNRPFSDEQRNFTAGLIEKIWGDAQ